MDGEAEPVEREQAGGKGQENERIGSAAEALVGPLGDDLDQKPWLPGGGLPAARCGLGEAGLRTGLTRVHGVGRVDT